MIEEFDKEMDALLRQAARGETAPANSKLPHLDADEISAFAENALPEQTKLRLTAHFADCERCRKILSNIILLNAEATKKTVYAPETAQLAAVAPWYRWLFAVPNLAYAMGALVLVFGGLIVFTFVKSISRDAEISQINEMPAASSNANFAGESVAQIQSNTATSNAASIMPNMSVANSAPVNSSDTPAANGSKKSVSTNSNAAATSNKPIVVEGEIARNESPVASDAAAPPKTENQIDMSGASLSAQKKPQDKDDNKAREEDKEVAQSDAPKPAPPATATRSAQAKASRKSAAENSETRSVGGKNFKRDGGVWYDSSYSGQSTTNVSRGTNEYQKLESGLRSIADSLGGTVVVVWKGRAYRIR